MPADIFTGQDAEDVATYVASVAGPRRRAANPIDPANPPKPKPPAGGEHRRKVDLRQRRLRRLPHAGRRGLGRRRSARTSTTRKPIQGARRRPDHQRPGRHAVVQGRAERGADRRRRRVRLGAAGASTRSPSLKSDIAASRSSRFQVDDDVRDRHVVAVPRLLDDALLEPVRAARGDGSRSRSRRPGTCGARPRAPAADRRPRSRRARDAELGEPLEARVEPRLGGRTGAVLVGRPRPQPRVERRADEQHVLATPSALRPSSVEQLAAADRLVGDDEDAPRLSRRRARRASPGGGAASRLGSPRTPLRRARGRRRRRARCDPGRNDDQHGGAERRRGRLERGGFVPERVLHARLLLRASVSYGTTLL